jgi:hypothetical protein
MVVFTCLFGVREWQLESTKSNEKLGRIEEPENASEYC